MDFDIHFDDFTSFLDSVGLLTSFSPLFDLHRPADTPAVEGGLQGDNETAFSR